MQQNVFTQHLSALPLLSEEGLQTVLSLLSKKKAVAIPTETVYGLAGDLFETEAIEEIFTLKGRPKDNPLIAHIGSIDLLDELMDKPPPLLRKLAKTFWPGPLTLIGKKSDRVPLEVTGNLPTIALRYPSHPCILQVLRAYGKPLAAPSANLSGKPSPTCSEDVSEDFQGRIAAIVDGGVTQFGTESTVIGFDGDDPLLLRPGALSRLEIEKVVGFPLKTPSKTSLRQSPGTRYRHYAPNAAVYLIEKREDLSSFQNAYIPSNLSAGTLYRELRKADRLQKKEIAILLEPQILLDETLMNRLEKISL